MINNQVNPLAYHQAKDPKAIATLSTSRAFDQCSFSPVPCKRATRRSRKNASVLAPDERSFWDTNESRHTRLTISRRNAASSGGDRSHVARHWPGIATCCRSGISGRAFRCTVLGPRR